MKKILFKEIDREGVKNLILTTTHDFKNAINIVSSGISYIEWEILGLEEINELKNELKSLLYDMKLSLNLFFRYINNIEILANLLSIEKEFSKDLFNLGSVIENIKSNILPHFEESNIKLVLDMKDCILKFNKEFLIAIIENLLLTSLRYSRRGGTVECNIDFDEKRKNLKIETKDKGSGIPEEKPEFIFTPESQWHSKDLKLRYGRGLALLVVSSIVEAVDGNITIKKENDTVITEISLPIEIKEEI